MTGIFEIKFFPKNSLVLCKCYSLRSECLRSSNSLSISRVNIFGLWIFFYVWYQRINSVLLPAVSYSFSSVLLDKRIFHKWPHMFLDLAKDKGIWCDNVQCELYLSDEWKNSDINWAKFPLQSSGNEKISHIQHLMYNVP